MPIIAMNVSSRKIDGLLPQQHREIDAKQAQIYKSMLPNEIKVIEVGVGADAPSAPLEVVPPQEVVVETSTITSTESVQVNEETFDDNRIGDLIGEDDGESDEAPLSIEEAFGESEAI